MTLQINLCAKNGHGKQKKYVVILHSTEPARVYLMGSSFGARGRATRRGTKLEQMLIAEAWRKSGKDDAGLLRMPAYLETIR